ncbi:MAG: putative hyperosmotically inducible periplasmic protein [Myxococcaceae bacterium]|nr:putative hyperosmotically inducible periplasmic protein [Myxococcaceae bacterium]
MKTHQVSALAILLAAGCAHNHHPAAEPPSAAGAHASQHEAHAAREPHVRDGNAHDEGAVDERTGERVAVPHHEKRAHLASSGHDLPAGKADPNAPKPATEFGTSADNTRVNERDRESTALTPMDQSEEASDRELVQRIRKAVIADDSLSFTAKNVKIITRDGRVTLRGAVNSAQEKATIEKAAREAAGPKHVTNELEVSN